MEPLNFGFFLGRNWGNGNKGNLWKSKRAILGRKKQKETDSTCWIEATSSSPGLCCSNTPVVWNGGPAGPSWHDASGCASTMTWQWYLLPIYANIGASRLSGLRSASSRTGYGWQLHQCLLLPCSVDLVVRPNPKPHPSFQVQKGDQLVEELFSNHYPNHGHTPLAVPHRLWQEAQQSPWAAFPRLSAHVPHHSSTSENSAWSNRNLSLVGWAVPLWW